MISIAPSGSFSFKHSQKAWAISFSSNSALNGSCLFSLTPFLSRSFGVLSEDFFRLVDIFALAIFVSS